MLGAYCGRSQFETGASHDHKVKLATARTDTQDFAYVLFRIAGGAVAGKFGALIQSVGLGGQYTYLQPANF